GDSYHAAGEEMGVEFTAQERQVVGLSQEEVEWWLRRGGSVPVGVQDGLGGKRQASGRYAVERPCPDGRGVSGARWQVDVQVRTRRGETGVLVPAHPAGVNE